MIRWLLCAISFTVLCACAKYPITTYKLSKELKEISGLSIFNDSILIAHNDGGNEPRLFFLSKKGEIIHSCYIKNAHNKDWEDITIDPDGVVYIADAGNNLNNRSDLSIVKLDGMAAMKSDTCSAELIHFKYENQFEYPPNNEGLNFDCESIAWRNDSLFLLSKPRNNPWKGFANLYALPTQTGTYIIRPIQTLFIGSSGWKKDAPTALEINNDQAIVLTYNRIIFFDIDASKWIKTSSFVFKNVSQKEAITTDTGAIYVGAEKHRILGGPFLYVLQK